MPREGELGTNLPGTLRLCVSEMYRQVGSQEVGLNEATSRQSWPTQSMGLAAVT